MRIPSTPRYLCGYDDRAWFIAAIPGRHNIVNVEAAREALKLSRVLGARVPAKLS